MTLNTGYSWLQMASNLKIATLLLQDVISILKNQSFPGGLHEDTLLLVMGDHGQTLNGDHGGGTAEEVDHVNGKTLHRDNSYLVEVIELTHFCLI